MTVDPLEKNAAFRLAYEFIISSMEEDEVYENLEFVNKDLPHKTIDKLIHFFENTEEYEKCSKLLKIKQTRLSDYSRYKL
jgi:inorganic pyrophosphatase